MKKKSEVLSFSSDHLLAIGLGRTLGYASFGFLVPTCLGLGHFIIFILLRRQVGTFLFSIGELKIGNDGLG
jgi:hypothetical protein